VVQIRVIENDDLTTFSQVRYLGAANGPELFIAVWRIDAYNLYWIDAHNLYHKLVD